MTTPANPDDLLAFLHQQLENQRFRGQSLKTLAFALPPETGAYLTETGELLLAEVDAKRRILDEHGPSGGDCRRCCQEADMQEFYDHETETETVEWERREMSYPCPTVRLLALPYAGRDGYRCEWAPA